MKRASSFDMALSQSMSVPTASSGWVPREPLTRLLISSSRPFCAPPPSTVNSAEKTGSRRAAEQRRKPSRR
jgi:hypothetical protein